MVTCPRLGSSIFRALGAMRVESRVPTVTIHSGSRVAVDGRTVSMEDLGRVLESRLQGLPDPTIKVVTSPSVSVGDAVTVMNVAAERNYTVVLKQL